MSDDLIRASLDEALLAIDAAGTPEGAVHAAVAQALASLVGPSTQTGARAGNGRTHVFDLWRREIESFIPQPLPDVAPENPVIAMDPISPGNPHRGRHAG